MRYLFNIFFSWTRAVRCSNELINKTAALGRLTMVNSITSSKNNMYMEKELKRRMLKIIFSGFLIATGIEYLYPFMVPLTITIVPTEIFLKTFSTTGTIPTLMFLFMIYYLYRKSGTLTSKLYPTVNVQEYLQEVSRLVRFYILFRAAIYVVTMTTFFLYNWFFLMPQGVTDFTDPIKQFYVIVSGLGPMFVTLSFIKIWYDHHLGKLLGDLITPQDFTFLEQTGSIKRYAMLSDTIIPIVGVSFGIFLVATSLILLETKAFPVVTWTWVIIFGMYLLALVLIQYFAFYKPITRLHQHFQDLVSGKADWSSNVLIEATHELGDIIRMYNILIGRIRGSTSLMVHSSKVITTQVAFLTDLISEFIENTQLIKDHTVQSKQFTIEQKNAATLTTQALETLLNSMNHTVKTIEDIGSDVKEALDTMRIIALNAELEAAQIQHESFFVLAENVVENVNEIQKIYRRILKELQALQHNMISYHEQVQNQTGTILQSAQQTEEATRQLEDGIVTQEARLNDLKIKVEILKDAQKSLEEAIHLLAAA